MQQSVVQRGREAACRPEWRSLEPTATIAAWQVSFHSQGLNPVPAASETVLAPALLGIRVLLLQCNTCTPEGIRMPTPHMITQHKPLAPPNRAHKEAASTQTQQQPLPACLMSQEANTQTESTSDTCIHTAVPTSDPRSPAIVRTHTHICIYMYKCTGTLGRKRLHR